MMKLKRINPVSLAKMLSIMHACIGLLMAVILTGSAFVQAATDTDSNSTFSLGWSLLALLLLPPLNAGLGFLTGLFISWFYNLTVRYGGGIQVEMEEAV